MSTEEAPSLEARQLHFRYRTTPVLRDLSIAIDKGEILALIGPNGCGKTTLLKQLSGVLAPQTGHVYLHGREIQQLTPKDIARQLAALEQHIHVDFAFTVEQIVAMGRMPYIKRLQGLSTRDRKIVDDAMTQTGIDTLRERHIEQISSGERQRVWLAMALAQQPKILLLDEPISHLDVNYQMEMLELLHTLSRGGLAIAMSIHELHLIGQFADRIAMIHEGQLHAVGTPREVLTPENIQAVFQVQVHIVQEPKSGRLLGLLPLRRTS